MHMPLDEPPASPTYVYLKTVSRHFGAETKMHLNVSGVMYNWQLLKKFSKTAF